MTIDLGQLTDREREVVLAAIDGASTQAVAGRLFISPRTVEHHLSAAYRKLGVKSRSALIALFREEPPAQAPVTRYAVSGDAHIAYQVVGEGDQDIVLIPGFISNVENAWTWPAHARFLRLLTAGRRLIVFDKRGTGLSDPVADPSRLTLEQRMDEVRAVMDAAGSSRATLFGFSEGAALSMLFAATYPSRTSGLILYGALISGLLDPEASGTASVFKDPARAWEIMRQVWGTGQFLAPFGPSAARLESGLAHIARFERHGASPAAAYAIIRMAGAIEVRALCAAVHTPCLVMHRRDDTLVPVANSRYLAGHLPAARYVELAGHDHPPWLGDNELLLSEVDRFMAADRPAQPRGTRLLQTIIMASEALSPAELAVVERFRGRPAASRHGPLYTFEGPVRAVECAVAVAQLRGSLRFGVHAGEIELRPGEADGAVPAIAAAVLDAAGPAEVMVTGVVKDLTLGADLEFSAAQDLRLPDGGRLALYCAGPRRLPSEGTAWGEESIAVCQG
jgi:pimeloyl-ACP methyl ester carboxylesterase/DNA-binding CsgD family transcriptional regulator